MITTPTPVSVVCPVCRREHMYALVHAYGDLRCQTTGQIFSALFAKTRAKNQHSLSRYSSTKVYQIRVILPNKIERLVVFHSATQRFELRAGDNVIISYYQGRPKIVQNCTINLFMVASEGCFIATAVYGSYEADEVLILREFRDQKLASSDLGKFLINCYYLLSPPIAELLEIFPFAKKPVKHVLDKIVRSVEIDKTKK